MAREFFKDLPNTTTPLNSARLNGLLNGEEAMGTIAVDDITSKNMINKNTFTLSYTYDAEGIWTFNDKNAISDYIKIKNNQDYTLSCNIISNAIVIHYFNSNKEWQTRTVYQSVDEIHITNTNNYSYVRISFNYNDSTTITQSIIDSMYFQFEIGEVATEYVEYKGFGIQSGSNSYGKWIKYDDGTMICWRNNYTDTIDITTEWGSLYVGEITNYINFPQTFKETPIVQYNILPTSSTGCFSVCYNQPNITTTHITKIAVARPRPNSNVGIRATYIAIGKWK